MVAETRETFTQFFDSMANTFRSTTDAGCKTNEAFFKAFSQNCRTPNQNGLETFFARGERFAKDFVPFMTKGMEVASESVNTTIRTGVDVFKAACDTTARTEEADFFKNGRKMMDATMEAFRTNFETFNKAGAKVIENWSAFCNTTCCDDSSSRTATKTTQTK